MKTGRFMVSFALVAFLCCFSARAQDQSAKNQDLDHMPLITDGVPLNCTTLQLLTESGELFKSQPVELKRVSQSFAKGPYLVLEVRFDLVKKLRTNEQGEIRLPKLKQGTYQWEIYREQGDVHGNFKVKSKPGTCTQSVKGVQIAACLGQPCPLNTKSDN